MNASSFGVKRSKFKVTVRSTMMENALFGLLTRYLKNYWTEFHQTFSADAFWDEDERFNFGGQKVKGQGHSMNKEPVREAIQRSMVCVELYFLVLK